VKSGERRSNKIQLTRRGNKKTTYEVATSKNPPSARHRMGAYTPGATGYLPECVICKERQVKDPDGTAGMRQEKAMEKRRIEVGSKEHQNKTTNTPLQLFSLLFMLRSGLIASLGLWVEYKGGKKA
jgi:hypothetical protein